MGWGISWARARARARAGVSWARAGVRVRVNMEYGLLPLLPLLPSHRPGDDRRVLGDHQVDRAAGNL